MQLRACVRQKRQQGFCRHHTCIGMMRFVVYFQRDLAFCQINDFILCITTDFLYFPSYFAKRKKETLRGMGRRTQGSDTEKKRSQNKKCDHSGSWEVGLKTNRTLKILFPPVSLSLRHDHFIFTADCFVIDLSRE